MIFVTGATGYLGGYALVELAQRTDSDFALLVRARDDAEARAKLWRGLQLHMDREGFEALWPRLVVFKGDLHGPRLGLSDADRDRLTAEVDSVLHIAASLNRKSAKACLNTNLRGTLSVIRLAREIADRSGMRRYSHVSTVAVAGHRSREVVEEDSAIDWDRSDYDPYGRTKKFCEHMAHELLPDVQRTIFRPSIVMGDTRHPRTSQFDMVQATAIMADLPAVPLAPSDRLDIVPADWVGRAIATVHLAPEPAHTIYHLSSGRNAPTAGDIGRALKAGIGRRPRFVRALEKPFDLAFRGMNRLPRGNPLQATGALMKVFMPYITYDTVFTNERIVAEVGEAPASFATYGVELYRWAKANGFAYPYVDL
ncbi:MAG: SDR family oxidoreductase [Myxococcales bacterium]|nr:SDR family oxidoreductase [Myxococcales bacterium]